MAAMMIVVVVVVVVVNLLNSRAQCIDPEPVRLPALGTRRALKVTLKSRLLIISGS